MLATRIFEVLEKRGQKQRWLLGEFRSRGYNISESYLSQIKAGSKEPGRRFIEAACAVLGMTEPALFYTRGREAIMSNARGGKAEATASPKKAKDKGKINVAIIGVGNCARRWCRALHSTGSAEGPSSSPA